MSYIKRAAESRVLKASKSFKVVLVTGPRQVGKTTMLKHLAETERENEEPKRNYVTLDDIEVRDLARRDPSMFLDAYPAPVLIDEVQYAPEILPYIKMRVDDCEGNGTYWLTGSQPFHLMQNVSESLAGRVCILEMLGLSNSEYANVEQRAFIPSKELFSERLQEMPSLNSAEVFERIARGSYPHISSLDEETRRDAYGSLIATYIMRDVHFLRKVGDESSFYAFLRACAAMNGRPINVAELARIADVDAKTAKSWLSILESSYVIKLLPMYSNNLLKRLTKAPVLHFVDTGLCAHLTGFHTSEQVANGAMAGHLVETFAHNEIYKSMLNTGESVRNLYFFRNKSQEEIDILLENGDVVYPIEVKKSTKANIHDLKAVRALKPLENATKDKDTLPFSRKVGVKTLLNLGDKSLPINEDEFSFPIWAI